MSDPVKEARATVNQIQEIAFTIPPMNPYTPQIVQVAAHLYEQLIAIDILLTEKDREIERLREAVQVALDCKILCDMCREKLESALTQKEE